MQSYGDITLALVIGRGGLCPVSVYSVVSKFVFAQPPRSSVTCFKKDIFMEEANIYHIVLKLNAVKQNQ